MKLEELEAAIAATGAIRARVDAASRADIVLLLDLVEHLRASEAQARRSLHKASEDGQWGALYAWLDTNKDAIVKKISDMNGHLENECDLLEARFKVVDAQADRLAELLDKMTTRYEQIREERDEGAKREAALMQGQQALMEQTVRIRQALGAQPGDGDGRDTEEIAVALYERLRELERGKR